MKRMVFKRFILLITLLVSFASMHAQAYFETIGGLRYLLDGDKGTATLVESAGEKYSGDIAVPEYVLAKDGKEYDVIAFKDGCFKSSNITSIVIPTNVTSLEYACFAYCQNLKKVVMPKNTIKSFGDYCFYGCLHLQDIDLPETLESIGGLCFAGCISIREIELPNSLVSLDIGSLSNMGITHISIPSSITVLNGLGSNSYLTDVDIPNSVTEIGWTCFSGCTNLAKIVIPESVTKIGYGCFDNCKKMENIYFRGPLPTDIEKSDLPTTTIFHVMPEYLQAYKEALGSKYEYIYSWDGVVPKDEEEKGACEMPVISYANGALSIESSTPGSECFCSISNADVMTDKYVSGGIVPLSATYKISAYATADGYHPSDKATATLYWINANLENDPSTNINQAKTRGIVATSNDGIVALSGLDNGEIVTFFTLDGRKIGVAKSENGIASCAVTSSVIIAKVGNQSIKLIVKE